MRLSRRLSADDDLNRPPSIPRPHVDIRPAPKAAIGVEIAAQISAGFTSDTSTSNNRTASVFCVVRRKFRQKFLASGAHRGLDLSPDELNVT